jgi:hypothetical protein
MSCTGASTALLLSLLHASGMIAIAGIAMLKK